MNNYILTQRDKTYLSSLGYPQDDFKWIEETANKCTYEYIKKNKERIDRDRTIALVGKKAWLSGIARACFHSTAVRCTKYANRNGDPYVLFDGNN